MEIRAVRLFISNSKTRGLENDIQSINGILNFYAVIEIKVSPNVTYEGKSMMNGDENMLKELW